MNCILRGVTKAGSPEFLLHSPQDVAFFLVPNDYYLLSGFRKNDKTKKKPKVQPWDTSTYAPLPGTCVGHMGGKGGAL